MRLRILGDASKALRRVVAQTDTSDIVELLAPAPHADAVKTMATCDALLLYQEAGSNAQSAVAGKTYEYLRAGKPILALVPPGDNLNLIERYAGYHLQCDASSEREILERLRLLHAQWRSGALPVHAAPKPEFLSRFNRRALTRELAGLFERACARAPMPQRHPLG